MTASEKIKETLQRELELLGKAREELITQLKSAETDAKKEWTRFSSTWKTVQTELKRAGDSSRAPAKELMGELKKSYESIIKELKKTPTAPTTPTSPTS